MRRVGETLFAPLLDEGGTRRAWFRDLDSNQDTQLQRLMSYQLDDPGMLEEIVAEDASRAERVSGAIAKNSHVLSGWFLWTLQRRSDTFLWRVQRKGLVTEAKKSEVLQGTLDLMILKTLHALGPQHGFGIARRIEQVSRDVLQLNEGTVYTSLLRLLQQGWIAAEWGTSENNRRAKFYSITVRGEKQLAVETENWERISGVVGRVLRLEGER
jgi:PadR family transcriptional regulator, regulatory protein PadR